MALTSTYGAHCPIALENPVTAMIHVVPLTLSTNLFMIPS
jgi:hypothetical protein